MEKNLSTAKAANDAPAIENQKAVTWQGGQATFQTRFGKLTAKQEDVIHFKQGILGFTDKAYCLIDFPTPAFSQFKILQSAFSEDLALIVMPLTELPYIEKDLAACCKELGIIASNLEFFAVTSVYLGRNRERMVSLNLRAPIIIDRSTKEAFQYVFPNQNYPIQFYLDLYNKS